MLARLGFDRLVAEAGYPGSEMVPALSALLSLLALKLLDKERRSHIDDFNCDEALGLFAGLNVLPKKSFATDYSYRTERGISNWACLQGWVKALAPVMFPEPPKGSRSTSTRSPTAATPRASTATTCRCEARPAPAC